MLIATDGTVASRGVCGEDIELWWSEAAMPSHIDAIPRTTSAQSRTRRTIVAASRPDMPNRLGSGAKSNAGAFDS